MQMIVKYRMLRERFFGRGIGKKMKDSFCRNVKIE
jgi:hypothetical protein